MQHDAIEKIEIENDSWKEEVSADIAGVRSSVQTKRKMSETAELTLNFWNNIHRDYQNNAFNRSQEKLFNLNLSNTFSPSSRLFGEFFSYSIGQDIKSFGQRATGKQRSSAASFLTGYEYSLLPNLRVRLAQGIAVCSNSEDTISEILPLGGIKVSLLTKLGDAYVEAGQNSDGDNALAGMYGTVYRRTLELGWNLNLSSNLSFNWFCEFSQDYSDQNKQVSGITQAKLTYQFSPTLQANASIGHRGHIDAEQGIRVNDGLVSSFTITASSF